MHRVVIVGLGNVGSEFTHTPHNLGIEILKWWAGEASQHVSVWQEEKKFQAELYSFSYENTQVDCLFPLTFMNDSGKAVKAYVDYFRLPVSCLLIIHDELELPAGSVELNEFGTAAKGHNGVRSIHDALGTSEVARLRLGVGRPPEHIPAHEFVLRKYQSEDYHRLFHELQRQTLELLPTFIQRQRPE